MGEDALLERAAKERDQGDFRAAMLDLKNALKKNPSNGEARLALGEVTLATGDAPSALRELEVARSSGIPLERVRPALAKTYLSIGRAEDALKLIGTPADGPRVAELLATRGVALLSLNRISAAGASFDQALAKDPKNLEALMGLATVTAQTESIPAALKIMERAVAVAATDPRVHILLGQFLLRAPAPARAQKEFEQAAQYAEKRKQGEQRFVAVVGQAEAALMQSHVEDSLAVTDRMLKLRPEHPLTRFMRARALLLAGKPGEARPLLEQNVSQLQNSTSSKMLLGAIALSDGTFEQAEMYLGSVINAEPNNVMARQMLAAARLKQRKSADAVAALLPSEGEQASSELLAAAGKVSIASGDTASGLDYLERSVKANPNDLSARLNLVAGYLSANRPDQAATLLEGVSGDAANVAQVRYLKALTLLAKGDQAGAVQFVTSTADSETKDAAAQMLAGSLLAAARDLTRARSYFERAIALKPDSTAAYLSLARLDVMQGNPQAARSQLTRAMERSKGDPAAALAMADFEVSQREPDKAVAVLETVLKAHPSFADARVRAVQILLQAGKVERANALAQEAGRAAPNLAVNQRMVGDVRMAQKKYSDAAIAYHKAATAEPGAAIAMREYEALRLTGTAADPLVPLRKIVEQQPKDAPALFAFAQAAQELGDRKTAIQAYQQLDALRPNNAAVLNNLAWLKYEERDPGAVALAKRAHEAAPRDPRVTDTYAWLLVENGKINEGLALLAPIATGSSDEQYRMHYAQALARAGRKAEARDVSAQLVKSATTAVSDAARKLVAELDRG